MLTKLDVVPVRGVNEDGSLYLRFITADGSEHDDELSPRLKARKDKFSGALWDAKYRIGSKGNPRLDGTIKNLTYLNEADPMVLEEVLVALESCTKDESVILTNRLYEQHLRPTVHHPERSHVETYRQLLASLPVAATLCRGSNESLTRHSNRLFTQAKKCLGSLDHPLLSAAIVALWIKIRSRGHKYRLNYEGHVDDLKFIDAHLDEVMAMRWELARVDTISAELIADLLSTTIPLRSGVL